MKHGVFYEILLENNLEYWIYEVGKVFEVWHLKYYADKLLGKQLNSLVMNPVLVDQLPTSIILKSVSYNLFSNRGSVIKRSLSLRILGLLEYSWLTWENLRTFRFRNLHIAKLLLQKGIFSFAEGSLDSSAFHQLVIYHEGLKAYNNERWHPDLVKYFPFW